MKGSVFMCSQVFYQKCTAKHLLPFLTRRNYFTFKFLPAQLLLYLNKSFKTKLVVTLVLFRIDDDHCGATSPDPTLLT